MANLYQPSLQPILDSNGDTASGGKRYFYDTGTSTLATVYSDQAGAVELSNPVVADASGRTHEVFLDSTRTYRVVETDASDVTLYDVEVVRGYDESAAANSVSEAEAAQAAAEDARDTTETYYNTLIGGYQAPAPKMDMYLFYSQSLGVARASLVTAASDVVDTLYTFNGGAEYAYFDDPTSGSITSWPAHPDNYETLENFVPYTSADKESLAAGIGYQSEQVGTADRSFYFNGGYGGLSARLLREGNNYWCGMGYGIQRAVELIRLAGFEPNPIVVWSHGHANADQKRDGNLTGETETSSADYQTACNKIFASLRRNVSFALRAPWTGPIWVEPLLTGGSTGPTYTLTGRKNIVAAQLALQSSGVRLLPAWSQFVQHSESDGVHPNGQGLRYRGELFGKYPHTTLRPPKMLSKAVVGSTVEVTFDQPVKISSLIPDGSSLDGLKGFEVYEDDGTTAKTISGVTVDGSDSTKVILTLSTVTNLTSTWVVRNGLHQVTTGTALDIFPRTQAVGTTDVGTTEDGIVMENASIPQEI